MATIIARPHPLRTDCYSANVADGATLYGLLGDMPESVLSQVDGEVWGRDRWGEPLPADALVTLYSTPEGDVGRAVAMIAVAVLAAYTGGGAAVLASNAGWSAAAAGAVKAGVAAAVTLAGSLAVNALIPPKMPSATGGGQSPNVRQSITGTRNQADPYGVVPRVYGNPRWYPKLAATPITEIAGDDQYLRMLLCLGYGPLEIDGARVGGSAPVMRNRLVGDAIRIGETSIDEFDDVQWEIGTANKLTMQFPDIAEEAVGVALNSTADINDEAWMPETETVSATRTTAPDTHEISLDLEFPQGLFTVNKKGDDRHAGARFNIEYRPTGTGPWTAYKTSWEASDATHDTLRINHRWSVPAGQYDVRITRTETMNYADKAMYTDCTWSVLRSIQQGAAYTGDHILMALRIRATDQLNGVVDQLNVKTQAVLRTYNGASFFDEPTSNPAWAYLDALTGSQVGRPVPDQQIDFAALREWAAFCDAQGLAYSWVHDGSETVLERARAVAAAGQASFSLQDGLFGVVRDDADAPVVQAVTPRNATGFNSSRTFKDLPHALRVKYIDPDTWSDAERIVYRDGYDASNATRFEDFETQGVASAAEAYHHGTYHFRQAILRPETYRVSMDWEHLAAVRGNRVRLAYDAIKVGLGWGRVKQFDGTTITLDESVQYTTQKAYGIRVRGAEGPQGTTPVTSLTVGQTTELRISTPVDVQPGDLVLYGELDKESLDCKVTKIENGGDFTADLTLVPAATDIYNYSDAPAWDPGITNPIPTDQIRPPTPTITSLRGDESASQINPDGSYQTLIRVAYSLPAQRGLPSLEVEARYRIAGASQWKKAGPFTASGNITIRDVSDGENYQVQVRAVNGMMYSPWSQTGTLAVTGQLISPPASIDVRRGTFTITLLPQGLTQNQQWEFYRSQAPLALGDVETAGTRLGIGATWTDTDLQPDTTYYYYVRGWSVAFTSAWYAIEVKTRNDPSAVMAAISGEIKKGDLWPALEQEIDRVEINSGAIDDANTRIDGVKSDLASEAIRLDGEISSVSSRLTAARSNLEQADTELSGRLDSAESAIVDERTERETEQGFIVERLDGLVRDTGDNRASIGRLQRIQQEGDELDAIIFEALNVESGSRQASIRTEEQVRIDGDSALAQRSDALEASIGDNAARITTVDQARADGDSALSSQIGELSAKVNALPQFGSGFEAGADFDQWQVAGSDTLTPESGDIFAGLQSALLTSTASNPSSAGSTGVTHAAIPAGATDAFEGFEITIRVAAKQPASGAAAEFAVAYSTNTAGNSAWQRFTSTATWQTFEFSYTVPEGGSATTDYIGIWADTSGAGNGILIDSVSVKRVAGEILEITAAIEQANQARADGDAALTQQLNTLTSTVGGNTSSIQQEAQTRADETTALAQQTTALRSDVDDNAAGITSVQQTVSDTESALSSRIDGISARTGSNESAINSERTARSDADSALSTRIDSVTATAGDNSAAITEEVRVRADETSANAARISGLTLNSSQQKAAIQALQRLRQEGTEIEAIQFESISVESASRLAAVNTEKTVRADENSAMASRVDTVQVQLGDEIASVEQQTQASINEQTGRINAMWTLRTDVNGLVGGIGLANDGQQVDFAVRADRFSIAPPGLPNDAVIPFIVKGSTTYLSEALIESLTFTKLQDGAGEFIVENGKLQAKYIHADDLVIKRGRSDNFVFGQSGWALNPTGGQINFPISFGNIQGGPPANADKTGSNMARDTYRVSGALAADVKEQAYRGNQAADRAERWTRPDTTLINGNKIFTGDAYVDTLQIKNKAIVVPQQAGGAGQTATSFDVTHDEIKNGKSIEFIAFATFTKLGGDDKVIVEYRNRSGQNVWVRLVTEWPSDYTISCVIGYREVLNAGIHDFRARFTTPQSNGRANLVVMAGKR